jgi:predicted ABC-type transport system involved in lysophospholipase L1 biosynthesis ATPase subunit
MVTHDQELATRSQRNIHILDGRINSEEINDTTQKRTAA